MPRKLKIKIYNAIIKPVIIYGAELLTLRVKDEKLLVRENGNENAENNKRSYTERPENK